MHFSVKSNGTVGKRVVKEKVKVPSRKASEVSPKFVVEARFLGLLVI